MTNEHAPKFCGTLGIRASTARASTDRLSHPKKLIEDELVAISHEEQEFLSSISGRYEHTYEALIKLKLVHAEGFSLLLPDFIAADINGWKWFQPKFFTACSIAYFDDFSIATLAIDFAETGSRFLVMFTSSQFVSQFDDGSHLYRCLLAGLLPPTEN